MAVDHPEYDKADVGAAKVPGASPRKASASNFELKARILQVVSRCLDTVPLEKLTIAMICERAGISRPTFYRQFSDRYDVFNWFLRTTMTSSFAQVGLVFDWRDAVTRFCRAMEANRELACKYLADRSAFSSYERFLDFVIAAQRKSAAMRYDNDEIPLRIEFQIVAFSRSFVASFVDWLGEDEMHDIGLHEFVDCTLSTIPSELYELLNRDAEGRPYSKTRLRTEDRAPLIEFVAEEFPTDF